MWPVSDEWGQERLICANHGANPSGMISPPADLEGINTKKMVMVQGTALWSVATTASCVCEEEVESL